MKAKRILSLVLALCMALTVFAVIPAAEGEATDEGNTILAVEFDDWTIDATRADGTTATVNWVRTDNAALTAVDEDGNGTVRRDGTQVGFLNGVEVIPQWQRTLGFFRAESRGGFAPFTEATKNDKNMTLEIKFKADEWKNGSTLFAKNKANEGAVLLYASGVDSNGDAKLNLSMKAFDKSWVHFTTADPVLKTNEWQEVTLTQTVVGDQLFTSLYVDGKEVMSRDDMPSVAETDKAEKEDDNYVIGGADYGFLGDNDAFTDFRGGHSYLLKGEIDYVRIYDYAKTFEAEINQDAVNNVIGLIKAAVAADAGTAEQLAAYKAALAAYNALENSAEKAAVTNYNDLAAVVDSYVVASGVILGFDFNGNYDEILGRVPAFRSTAHTTMGETAVTFDGTQLEDWSKIMGFDHTTYPVFEKTTGDLTIELKVNAVAYDNSALFSFTWGNNQWFKLVGESDNTLSMPVCKRFDTEIKYSSADPVLVPGQDQTITITQKKVGETTTTTVYVDGVPTITTDAIVALADWTIWGDDIIMVGASDHGNETGSQNLFKGSIDSFYMYNYAKEFVDPSEILKMSISEPASVPNGDRHNLTWGGEVKPTDGFSLNYINANVKFKEYGVIYGAAEDVVKNFNDTETDTVKKFVFGSPDTDGDGEADTDDINVYSIFGFRLKGVPTGATRAAKFYLTYEYQGVTYTIYSDVSSIYVVE